RSAPEEDQGCSVPVAGGHGDGAVRGSGGNGHGGRGRAADARGICDGGHQLVGGRRGGDSKFDAVLAGLRDAVGTAAKRIAGGRECTGGTGEPEADLGSREKVDRGGSFCRNGRAAAESRDRKSTRLNSSHDQISYAVFCL